MKGSQIICVVGPTSSGKSEFAVKLAKKYNYQVVSLIVENRHGGVNQHGVPDEALTRMKDRFEIKL